MYKKFLANCYDYQIQMNQESSSYIFSRVKASKHPECNFFYAGHYYILPLYDFNQDFKIDERSQLQVNRVLSAS
ncbi:hypothetical protein, partial [Desulfobacter sp. UBA2225]|uniref:hypothetical protein n=1 Tax=Desulfobacter sp. UBA2225 TaxID=1961413 RepID=UPI00257A7ED1